MTFALKHGTRDHPLYTRWKAMRKRCNCQTYKDYKNYGARGIKVCERWDDFAAFVEDMAPKFQPGLLLDREDNDGHYTPENTRWVTIQESNKNKRKVYAPRRPK